MRQDFYYPSQGIGRIHACCWKPEGQPRAVLQIVHGIAEFIERYDDFANFLTKQGFLVVAEDHMGHGQSIGNQGTMGYFHGGWFTAVADTYRLLSETRKAYPEIPYILFGHSMGSFMARTILCRYPEAGLTAAIICGTGWQPTAALPLAIKLVDSVCAANGEDQPSLRLEKLVFGGYNKKVEHPRTPYDWLTRDAKIVDEYIASPLCGFTPTAGLLRDMMTGILYIQRPENLAAMDKKLPVYFIAGGDDPVGSYGRGVDKAAEAFEKAGMTDVSVHIYPLGRHEILNEINKEEVYADVLGWIQEKIAEKK